jgi:ribonuclease-3
MIAEKLGVYNFLYLSRGESQDTNKKARGYILANAMEALLGAIYLDQGFRVVDKFIKKNILSTLPEIIASQAYIDAKSRFQEKAQEINSVTPRYRVLSESGPDHNKKFIIGVYLDKELVADGEGYSKQEAQTDAATKALKVKGW